MTYRRPGKEAKTLCKSSAFPEVCEFSSGNSFSTSQSPSSARLRFSPADSPISRLRGFDQEWLRLGDPHMRLKRERPSVSPIPACNPDDCVICSSWPVTGREGEQRSIGPMNLEPPGCRRPQPDHPVDSPEQRLPDGHPTSGAEPISVTRIAPPEKATEDSGSSITKSIALSRR
jgi:hypothetical protein